MFGHDYYNETIRTHVIIFGTLFNDLIVQRFKNNNELDQLIQVPLSYGPKDKFLARLRQDPNLNRQPALVLPRMGFEITNITYDSGRKLATLNRAVRVNSSEKDKATAQFFPVPYDLQFDLTIYSKNHEDGTQIMEQILPFFTPQWTVRAFIQKPYEQSWAVPITLLQVIKSDSYEGDFTEIRAHTWTLTFNMKSWFFGPKFDRDIIKNIKLNFIACDTQAQIGNTSLTATETYTIEPGLTANGTPTSNASNSVSITEIDINDDYGYIESLTSVDERLYDG